MKKLIYLLLAITVMLSSVISPASAAVPAKNALATSHFTFTASPEEMVYDGQAKDAQYTTALPTDWTNISAVVSNISDYTGLAWFAYLKDGSSEELSSAVEAGVYQVILVCAGDENYLHGKTTDDSWTFEIKKAALSITPPVPVAPFTEDGAEHALVTPGSVEALPGDEVKMVYSLSPNGPFSEEIPTASAPGTYKVYYTAEEHSCYETAEVASCDVTINAAVTPTPKPTATPAPRPTATPAPQPTATPSPAPAPLPETGDGTPLMMLAALAALSCLCIFAFLQKNKRVSE